MNTPEPQEPEKQQNSEMAASGQGQADPERPASSAGQSSHSTNPGAASASSASGGSGTSDGGGQRPKRRWPLVTGAVVAGLVLLAAGFAVGRITDDGDDRRGWYGRGAHARFHDGPRHGPWVHWKRGHDDEGERRHRYLRFSRGNPGIVGTVASVSGAEVVVNTDGGGPVPVATTDRTKVFGNQRGTVSDLKPGDRVVTHGRPGEPADVVVVLNARVQGTVTALDGDRATVTRPNGLTQVVDLAEISNKPAVGDRVAIRGTTQDNGTVLKAQSVRVLPKSS